MAFKYLNKQLQTNLPRVVTLVKRWNPVPEKDFTTKEPTGRQQYPYDFALEDNEIVKHYASEREEETIKLFRENDKLQVVRQEQVKPDGKRISFNVWTTVGGVEAQAASSPPLRSNVAQKTYEKHQDERVNEDKIKQVMISLAGLTQAHISAGKTNSEALQLASEARNLIIQKAISIVEANL